jgi:hypothetical protein
MAPELDFDLEHFRTGFERELMRDFLQRKERERDQSLQEAALEAAQEAAEEAALDLLPQEQESRVRQRAGDIRDLIDQAKRWDVEAAKRLAGIVAEHRIRKGFDHWMKIWVFEDASDSKAARKILARLLVAEDRNPDCVEHPCVASLMNEARELMHGHLELATVREEVRVEEARQRMRGRTDAPR